jgi:hypothetical protein
VPLLVTHCIIGVAAGLTFAGLCFALDVGQLRSLLFATRDGAMAAFMLCFALAAMFGSVAMGVGVMTLPRDTSYGQKTGLIGLSKDERDDQPL